MLGNRLLGIIVMTGLALPSCGGRGEGDWPSGTATRRAPKRTQDAAAGRFVEGCCDKPPTMECNASGTEQRAQVSKAVGFTISLLESTNE